MTTIIHRTSWTHEVDHMTLVEPTNSDKTTLTDFCALKQIINTMYTGTEGFQCISDRRDELSWHRHLRVTSTEYLLSLSALVPRTPS